MTSEELAWKIRRHAIEMTHRSGAGHIGSVLSAADILACLYADIMRVRPDDPEWNERDRLVLSKGHAAAGLYAALAEVGFFPVSDLLRFTRMEVSCLGMPPIMFEAWISRPARSVRAYLPAPEWPWPASRTGRIIAFLLFLETANAMKALCGRRLCLLTISASIT